MKFPPEDAITIALALLDDCYCQKGRQKPSFLGFLIEAEWVEQRTQRQSNNQFALRSKADRNSLLSYMHSHYGEQWQTAFEPDETREEFLKKHLVSPLPVTLHSRVKNAVWGEHSKKTTSIDTHLETLDSEIIQLRTRTSCQLHFSSRVIDCLEEMDFADAIILNEKALSQLTSIQCDEPVQIITVENAGAWQHLPLPKPVMAIFVPGNNYKLTLRFLSALQNFQWCHFGDLDQKGLDIAAQLARSLDKPIKLLIPEWWSDYQTHFAQKIKAGKTLWRTDICPYSKHYRNHPLLNSLVEQEIWLEQEAIMLDTRLEEDIRNLLK
ncbi:Wadjet anti-phage system protein JetD domain-containing protein [uncultured Endozoicomonas sp.]|uniref:Wadjet anti-phage system protein JetD domain-containing protein n=1 Tax=uncultured Endozoicomonas sp. TaxID=432652 RepID=UPI0026281642|nr:Wadjet anti-phage system protein JetD domain-containing protein [uncultured Endozoicomonas sp.]